MNSKKKQWPVILSAFLAGLFISGGIGGCVIWRLVKVIHLDQTLSAAAQAQTTLLYLKRVDWGTSNSIAKLQETGRERLSGYIHDVEQSKKEGQKLDEMTLDTYQVARAYLFPFTFAERAEEDFFWKSMLPLAKGFVEHNELPAADFSTNNISNYRVEFFQDGRPGCIADLKLKDGYTFSFVSDGTRAEVSGFNDGKTRTYYSLENAPKEKIDAVKALLLRNRLNKTNALELTEKFFRLQGHKDENFHQPEIHQSYWSGGEDGRGGDLPYFETTWYRKDVNMDDVKGGEARALLKSIRIQVSGIDAHLISYSKGLLPLGRDF